MKISFWYCTLASVSLLAMGLAAGGCSHVGSSDEVVAGEVLWERLVKFERMLDQPVLDPFYAGVSFEGSDPSSDNLVIFLLDEEKEAEARTALSKVFGQSAAEGVEIEIWTESGTIASEELKSELPVFEAAESVTSLDYDEQIDRLSIGIRDLGAVRKLEEMLQRKDVPREAVAILPEEYVQEE